MKKIMLSIGALTTLLTTMIISFFVFIIVFLGGGAQHQKNASADTQTPGGSYVKHWTTGDPYTHNLLDHRYGITAEQLDGFLKSTGIPYQPNRINGELLLQWEKDSGLDVRAIIAIAQAESSLGTAGVATEPGANMFGYGAFDNDPGNASNYNDSKAVVGLTKVTIIENKNETFKAQDDKAKALANGTWTPAMGGVYFTDTSGTGKRRADIMAAFDKWIDNHGGTPDPPGGFGPIGTIGGGSISLLESKLGTYIDNGQCYMLTSYYAKGMGFGPLVGHMAAADIGTDYDWKSKGWVVETDPSKMNIQAGDIINFKRGAVMGGYTFDATYGHTAVVSEVNSDNTLTMYTQNPDPVSKQKITIDKNGLSSIIHPPKDLLQVH
jgi:beta-N-acetylglucosaminidase